MPRCGRSQERSSDQTPSMVLTWTSQNPSSSRAYSPRPWLTVLWPKPHSGKTPIRQPAIDRVLVGVDQAAERNAGQEQWLDRGLPNIGQQMQDYGAAALNHAKNRRLFL